MTVAEAVQVGAVLAGIFPGTVLWLWMLIFLGLAMALTYLWGRRRNVARIQSISGALERTLAPKDKTYTWIGGLIGFHATYVMSGAAIADLRITATLLPRHSLLFLPVSRLLMGSDRLFLTAYLARPFEGELHVVRPSHLRWRLGGLSERGTLERGTLERAALDHGALGRTVGHDSSDASSGGRSSGRPLPELTVLFHSPLGPDLARIGVTTELARDLVHFAVVPDESTVFIQIVPRNDAVVRAAGRALLAVVEQLGRTDEDETNQS
ncbi:MAG: hypothetical protein J7M25_07890 [Deltaproteobacteria bacterium]|nr:hypothetical protein [Deltaproteobacteria bacterium]